MSEMTSEGKQTTAQAMYPQLKRSLENLIEEFRYLSLKYGPIRHEMFKAFDDERTTEETWIAFAEAQVDSGKVVAEWEEWDGPNDGSFYGRFSGDGSGMEDFTDLAESAFLTLCEFDRDSKKTKGFHGWIALLHDMGFKYPTSLLCSDMSVWGLDEEPDLDDLESYTSQWVESEGQTPYPKHPLCWRLVHNVFVSSIAALRILLEPEMALLVGHSLDDFPLPFHPPQPSTQDSVGEAMKTPREPPEDGFSMAKGAKGFRLSFQLGDIQETEPFPLWDGLRYIFALYSQPGKAIPIEEMQVAAGLAYQPLRGISIDDIEMHIERHGRNIQMHGGPGVVENALSDDATEESVQAVRDKLKNLELMMKEPLDEKTYDEADAEKVLLKKELSRIARYPKSPNPAKQDIPKVVNVAVKNITDKVRNAIDRARREIKTLMPKCGDYLYRTVDYENQGWIYDPKRVIMRP